MDEEKRNFSKGKTITNIDEANAAIELQRTLLRTMAELVEFRDGDTGKHIERTQNYLGILLGIMIMNEIYIDEIDTWDIWLVSQSVQLHDIGKIAIKDSILQKPGRLTAEEFEEIKTHTVLGEEIIKRIEKRAPEQTFLEYARIFAVSHHEKWDGSGYPRGLSGRDIPLQGRLMAIADVYDALISERPYKKGLSHEEAVEIIVNGKGTHFDPLLVDVFIEAEDKFNEIAIKYKDA